MKSFSNFLTLAVPAAAILACALPVSATVVAIGKFQSKEAAITAKGGFEIREEKGAFRLVIGGDFVVSEGPDLYFTFNPLPASQVTGSNAKTYALRIDPKVAALSGAQSYDLPSGFDASKYGSLLVHCWQFNHLYAVAAVEKPAASALRMPSAAYALRAPGRDGGRFWSTRGTGRSEARDLRGAVRGSGNASVP